MYIADASNYTVRILNIPFTRVKTIFGTPGTSGNTNLTLGNVTGLTSRNGPLFFADSSNNRIRTISSPLSNSSYSNLATYTTLANQYYLRVCDQSFVPNTSIVYLIDADNTSQNVIRSVDLSRSNAATTVVTNFPGYTGGLGLGQIIVDSALNIYFGSQSLIRFTSGTITNLIPAPLFTLALTAIVADSTFSKIYISTQQQIYVYNVLTFTHSPLVGSNVGGYADGIGNAARFASIVTLVIDSYDSNLYMIDQQYVIRRVNIATSNVTTLVGSAGQSTTSTGDGIGAAARLGSTGAIGLSYGKSGKLYFTDDIGSTISLRMIDIATSNLTTLFYRSFAPYSIASVSVNPSESIVYMGISGALQAYALPASLQTLAGSTAGYSNAQGTSALFSNPKSITYDGSNLIVSDTGNIKTRYIDINANVTDVIFYKNTMGVTQTLNMYSNTLYTALTVGSNSAVMQYSLIYPSTTFTFSNTSNTLIQNATGRPVTIAVPGGTVTNSNLNSVAEISDIKTLYNTSGTTYTLY